MGKHPLPKLMIEYEVKDKNGKILSKGKLKSQTWVGNLVGLLSSLLKGGYCPTTGNTGYTYSPRTDYLDVGGNARGICLWGYGNSVGAEAPANTDSYGILIGSSDIPVTIGQYTLGSKISHGTGAGQMIYNAVTVETMIKDTTYMFRVIRTFTNNSGGTITVREMALVLSLTYPSHCVMLARDVITGGINVPNGSTLTLRYIISHSLG